jgi:hypothetical protein
VAVRRPKEIEEAATGLGDGRIGVLVYGHKGAALILSVGLC